MHNREPLRCVWPAALCVWFACAQTKPHESAQTAQNKLAPAPSAPTPRVEPIEAGATPASADASSAAQACEEAGSPSPLALAAFEGDAERARVLVVQAEQDASAPAGCAATPLMMAISAYSEAPGTPPSEARARTRGKLDAAGLFLARCFDIAGTDAQGTSALHAAVAAPYPDHVVTRLVERMLECGVSPDLKTKQGVTPLMLAVAAKRKGLVKTFLEGGADVHAQSDAGDTPLSIAETKRDRDLLSLLKKPPSRDGGK